MTNAIYIDREGPHPLVSWSESKPIDIIVAGTKRSFYSSASGTLLLQEYISNDFSLGYIIMRFSRKTSVGIGRKQDGVKFQASLRNNLSVLDSGIRHMLRSGYYRLSQDKERIAEILTGNGKDQRFLYVNFPPAMLEKLGISESEVNARGTNGVIREEMAAIISALFNAPYSSRLLEFYYENKIRELLFEIITAGGKIKATMRLTSREAEAIYAIDSVMATNIVDHMTIDQLSKKSGLSAYRLNKGFQEIFGIKLFERLLQRRMDYAKKLLADTDTPMKEISSLVGYRRLTSFMTVFRKKVGVTPGEYRFKNSM